MTLFNSYTRTLFKGTFVSFSLLALLSGCQTAHSQPAEKKANQMAKLETVYNFSLQLNAIKFDVISTGCTKPQDFLLNVVSIGDNTLEVGLIREKSDFCRAMPKLTQITMKLPQMKNDKSTKVVVKNPISVDKPSRRSPARFNN